MKMHIYLSEEGSAAVAKLDTTAVPRVGDTIYLSDYVDLTVHSITWHLYENYKVVHVYCT